MIGSTLGEGSKKQIAGENSHQATTMGACGPPSLSLFSNMLLLSNAPLIPSESTQASRLPFFHLFNLLLPIAVVCHQSFIHPISLWFYRNRQRVYAGFGAYHLHHTNLSDWKFFPRPMVSSAPQCADRVPDLSSNFIKAGANYYSQW